MISVSPPGVLPLCSTPYSGSAIASASATSTGMYSGRQPAITPFTATLQIVAARLSGSMMPRTSSGSRFVCARNASMRARVGGTMGRPSLHSRSMKCWFRSLKPPLKTMSRAPGSAFAVEPAAMAPVRFAMISGTVTLVTLWRNCSGVCTAG